MFLKLLLIYFMHSVSADYFSVLSELPEPPDIIPRCSDNAGVTFTAKEGYKGRYIAELCTEKNRIRAKWEVKLRYFNSSANCNAEMKNTVPDTSHSDYSHWVSSDHECTDNEYVCISVPLDMIFSACYYMLNSFNNNEIINYFNITNPYTKEVFQKNRVTVDTIFHDEYVEMTWHTGIPTSDFTVILCNDADQEHCELVKNCSVVMQTSIKCYLDPTPGSYALTLRHDAPWVNGIFSVKQSFFYDLNLTLSKPVSAAGGGAAARWWAAGAGVLVAATLAAAALAAARARGVARRQRDVLKHWLDPALHLNTEAAVDSAKPEPCRHVLLLYARECPAATRAIEALKVALQHVIEGQVLDVFSPGVVAACAGSPAEWVRATLRRRDVAVLLLQSPALQLLHAHDDGTVDGTHLVTPLLGRRVVARVPHLGDALLQFALRLTTENVHTRDNYNKYYVATISALPTETLPCLVPYRRFPLPAALPLLLQALSKTEPDQQHIDNFTLALKEFTDYANENKDYLMDEFMFIDN